MDSIKVSIIIPIFNSEKYLAQCLESCIKQTLNDIEIICINDSSTDNSLEILQEYAKKDRRIKIINKKNKGAGFARNEGVKIAQGKYLIFLDSDDFLELNALEILYNQIEKDGSDVIFYNTYWLWERIEAKNRCDTIAPYRARFSGNYFLVDEAYDILFDTNALAFRMYRKDIWLNNEIKYSNHKLGEDSLPYFKFLANCKKISICDSYLYNYRKHNSSASAKIEDKVNDLFEIFYLCENAVEKSKNGEFLIESYLNNRIRSFIFWLHNLDLTYRKTYYKKIQKIFLYIKNKYGLERIKNSEKIEEFEKIIIMPYFKYRFLQLTQTLYIILKSHIV